MHGSRIFGVNTPSSHIWSARTIPGIVARAGERYASETALEEGELRWTFAELAAEVRRTAKAFVAAGLQPGDRVAVWAPNTARWILAAAGAQAVGGILVTLNTRLKGREAGFILRRSGARFLIHVEHFLGLQQTELLRAEPLPELTRRVLLDTPSWDDFIAAGAAVSDESLAMRAREVRDDDIADIIFTSGTTGEPKGVMCSHAQNLQVFEIWADTVGLRHGDRYLIVNPFFHTFGYKSGWLACLLRGATILPMAVFDAGEVLRRIVIDRISVLPGPPTLFQALLEHPERKHHDVSSLRLAVTGAASVPVALIERMQSELGFRTVVTAYGLTESTGVVSICRPGDAAERIARTCGAPIPHTEVKIVDETGNTLATGNPGEVLVRGYNVMQGYFADEAATRTAISPDGWLHTGDIGILDEAGYLRITDRKKDMFIVGGFNCYPAEIENIMSAHPAIAQVAVTGMPDERLGEVALAHVVVRNGAQIDAATLIAWCRNNMANYKVPRQIAFVTELPMTASGKVQRFALRSART